MPSSGVCLAGGMGLGAAAGTTIAKRMAITELPQMVAAFHSLVGLAAVTTSIASFMAHPDPSNTIHLTSSYLGTLIGAVTLTGGFRGLSRLSVSFSIKLWVLRCLNRSARVNNGSICSASTLDDRCNSCCIAVALPEQTVLRASLANGRLSSGLWQAARRAGLQAPDPPG